MWGNLGICILFSPYLFFWAILMAASVESMSWYRPHLLTTCVWTRRKEVKDIRQPKSSFFNLISPSNLPIRSATITGGSISFKNKMLKFNFKLLQGDELPIHMLTICVRSCDVYIFFFSWNLTGMWRLFLSLQRAGKDWREEVHGEKKGGRKWRGSCCTGLISLRTLHAFCLCWAQRAC